MQFTSSFLKEFSARGFFHQATHPEEIDQLFHEKKVTAYLGFDCTARSLHIGSLLQIMILRLLQKHGHIPIALLGGGTTKIADPTGKDEARKMLSYTEIDHNMEGIRQNLEQYLTFNDNQAHIVNNDDWLNNINYMEFLRDYGPLFSVNRMITMDSVRLRLEREQNMSFLEFNYMLLQAYDFLYLNQKYDCILQIGGSDQWGNIIAGVELNRKKNISSYGLTTPLITTANGAKMGKSMAGAVWLNAEMLSAYDYWQYWRNVDDRDVFRFMRYFTDITPEEIMDYENSNANINEFKKMLADHATIMCHGEEKANEAGERAKKTFELGEVGENLPTAQYSRDDIDNGQIKLINIMRDLKLVESGGEAKRLIIGKAVEINGRKIDEENYLLSSSDIIDDTIIITVGKKKKIRVKVV